MKCPFFIFPKNHNYHISIRACSAWALASPRCAKYIFSRCRIRRKIPIPDYSFSLSITSKSSPNTTNSRNSWNTRCFIFLRNAPVIRDGRGSIKGKISFPRDRREQVFESPFDTELMLRRAKAERPHVVRSRYSANNALGFSSRSTRQTIDYRSNMSLLSEYRIVDIVISRPRQARAEKQQKLS